MDKSPVRGFTRREPTEGERTDLKQLFLIFAAGLVIGMLAGHVLSERRES